MHPKEGDYFSADIFHFHAENKHESKNEYILKYLENNVLGSLKCCMHIVTFRFSLYILIVIYVKTHETFYLFFS